MEILEEAKNLGLNNYEAKVYLALFERNSLSVNEIAKISRVPRARIYDILESLMTKGLATLKLGNVKRYSAVEPELFEEKLINQLEVKHIEKKQSVTKAIQSFKQIFKERADDSLLDDDTPQDYIEIIKDLRQTDNIYEQLLNQSKKEVLTLSKQNINTFTAPKKLVVLDHQVDLGLDIIKRGVSVKCIYEIMPDEKVNKTLFNNIIDKFAEAGEQIRLSTNLPIRLSIFDEKIAMYTLIDPLRKIDTSTQVVRHPVMAKSLKILFNALWDQSEDYYEYKKRMNVS